MNDDPIRKKITALRVPAPGPGAFEDAWEHALEAFESARPPSRPAPAPPVWSWRDWLWPSPYAWTAFAAVWITFFAVHCFPGSSPENDELPPTLASRPGPGAPASPGFALNEYRSLVLEYQQLALRR